MENQKAQVRVPATMPEKFRWLKAVLRDSELTDGAKIVAAALYTFHNQATGRCDPSQAAIGDATDMHRQAVSVAVRRLREGEWIRTVSEPGSRLNYILNVGRAATDVTDMSGQEDTLDAGGVSANPDRGVSANPDRGVSAKPDRGCPPSRTGGVRETGHVTTKEPPRETTNLNQAPVAAAIEPVTGDPAIAQTVAPDRPETKLPAAANDDVPGLGVVRISGLEIPGDMYAEWETSFRDIDLRASILSRAKWAAGLSEKRPGHRMRALQTELAKLNDKARQERLSRQENRQADVEAGIERDPFYGRPIRKQKRGWIENPRAKPEGEGRYWTPPTPGTETVFRGKGYSLTQAKLDEGLTRWPAIDFRAAVTEFDADHASPESSEIENRNKLAAFLDARQAEAMAA